MSQFDSYAICTSPRSGSTLLCNMLTATGIAGKPKSYFFGNTLDGWIEDLALDVAQAATESDLIQQAMQVAMAKGRNGTAIFGQRLQAHSLAFFLEKLAVLHPDAANDAERFQLTFGRTLFVHLRRPDKLDQAISYLKARQTGLWHMAPDGSELERTAAHRDPVYDRDQLHACIETFAGYDQHWDNWFASQAIVPVRLSYDALSLDPLGTLRLVLEQLGLDPTAADSVTPGVKKLADGINDDWAARYRAESVPVD